VTRLGYLVYSAAAYATFAISLAWAVLFLTGLREPPLVDSGRPASALPALTVDATLLGLFALQHSLMSRRATKRLLGRLIPGAAERSTFVLAASAVLLLLFWAWLPLPRVLWQLEGPAAAIVGALGWAGWSALVAATFMIDHLDLFGLRQGWRAFRNRGYAGPRFQTHWFYRWVRHPLMTSFLVIFWAVPRMTVGHALFSLGATAYIAVGIWFEERDLRRVIPEYADYQREVGALFPRPVRHRAQVVDAAL
jgi:protein-S-isoprenylcysteine O-methyltransferase Ste14